MNTLLTNMFFTTLTKRRKPQHKGGVIADSTSKHTQGDHMNVYFRPKTTYQELSR